MRTNFLPAPGAVMAVQYDIAWSHRVPAASFANPLVFSIPNGSCSRVVFIADDRKVGEATLK